MIINPIVTESGGQVLERRSGWLRSAGQGSISTGNVPRDGTADAKTVSGFAANDQLSKGLIGQMMTPERQDKIDLAQGVQIADRGMEAINEALQQAKDDLAEIRKMFPPFPRGSKERAEFLNSYGSLRTQIDKLTFPPESDTAAQLMGNTVAGEPLAVGPFPVHSGPEGLNLVKLDKPVDELQDEELPALIEDLERASGVLYERRMSLEASVGKIFKSETVEKSEFIQLSREVQERFSVTEFSISRPESGIQQELSFLG